MVAVSLLAAISVATSFDAKYVYDPNGHSYLVVRQDGQKHIVGELALHNTFGKPFSVKDDYDGIKFHGHTFQHKDNQIVNVRSGVGIDIKPVSVLPQYDGMHNFRFKCDGCAVIKDSMLWIYTMSDIDNMGEPYAFVDAFLVREKKGKPVLVKGISIPGLEGGLYSPRISRVGNSLYFGTIQLAISELSLNTWTAKSLAHEDMALSDDGKLFWLNDRQLKLWNPSLRTWNMVRKCEQRHLEYAKKVGQDYLLQFKDAMAYAYSGRSCPIPDESFKETFMDPKLGIGFAWRADKKTSRMTGLFYRISDLKLVGKID